MPDKEMYLKTFEDKYRTVLTDEMRYDVRILAATYLRHATYYTSNPEAVARHIIELAEGDTETLCDHTEEN